MTNIFCFIFGHQHEDEIFNSDVSIFKGNYLFYCPRCDTYFIQYMNYIKDEISIRKMTESQKNKYLKLLKK